MLLPHRQVANNIRTSKDDGKYEGIELYGKIKAMICLSVLTIIDFLDYFQLNYNHLMSHLYDQVTTIEEIVYLVKNFHEEEKALNSEFTEQLAQVVTKICEQLSQLQGMGEQAEKVKDTVEVLMMFLDSKAKVYSNTIGQDSQIS